MGLNHGASESRVEAVEEGSLKAALELEPLVVELLSPRASANRMLGSRGSVPSRVPPSTSAFRVLTDGE